MIKFFSKFPRQIKQLIMVFFDTAIVIFCLLISFSIRLGYWFYPGNNFALLLAIFLSPLLAIPIFRFFGLYHEVIRHVGFKSLWKIMQATSFFAILWGLITFMALLEGIPRSVILINWTLVMILVGGSRLLTRWLLLENKDNNVLIYGAGSAGRQLTTALNESSEFKPIAFIDDAIEKYNNSINGLKVYSRSDLNYLITEKKIKEVFIAIPSLSRKNLKRIINFLEPFPITVRSLPGVSDLAQGKVKTEDLHEIDLSDLLGRESVSPNKDLLKLNITKKIILVTGAGGSIGAELCRQILFLKPQKLILYDVSESSLYSIEQELISFDIKDVEIVPIIGSVTDKNRMNFVFDYYEVQIIYHAAAYKHVPLVEFNQSQGIYNNAIGTLVAAQAAISSNVKTFVLISTDKAVRPKSIMGASKRIAELILQSLNLEYPDTCFTMVRFGNVVDSSGSVIPLFRKQIKAGGPVTVTHSDIVRYFMTIPEAVQLVLHAGSMAEGGEVFVLDMGQPIKIYDLAVKMINLSGMEVLDEQNPNGDIEIVYTGLRPGEKLFEELLVDGNFTKTENSLIMRAKEEMLNWDELHPLLAELEKSINSNSKNTTELIKKIVPEFKQN